MHKNDFEQTLKHLAQDIKAHRLAAGLSQEELAMAAAVDRTYVSQLERGVANPSVQILHRISIALSADLNISFGSTTNSRS